MHAQEALSERPGNPAALHAGGRAARRMLEDARERASAALGAERAELVFTSGATESDALALLGASRGMRNKDATRSDVWMSRLEHDAANNLKRWGVRALTFASLMSIHGVLRHLRICVKTRSCFKVPRSCP